MYIYSLLFVYHFISSLCFVLQQWNNPYVMVIHVVYNIEDHMILARHTIQVLAASWGKPETAL